MNWGVFMKDQIDSAWNEFETNLSSQEAANFFNHIYSLVRKQYSLLYPNSQNDDAMWSWCLEQLIAARHRSLAEEVEKRLEFSKQLKRRP